MAKDTLWFKHDTNSRSDEKIIELQMEHGMEGIGVYWCIIEMLYEQMGVMRMQCDRIAFELRTHKNVVEDVLKKYGLFQIDGDIVTNRRVTEEVEARCKKSEQAAEAAKRKWEQVRLERDMKTNDADAMRTQSNGNASAMQRREEKRRGEDNREENITFESDEKKSELPVLIKKNKAIAPKDVAPDEMRSYFTEIGYPHEADKFIDYYSSNGWKVGKAKNPMKDWQASVRNWCRRADEAKGTSTKLNRTQTITDVVAIQQDAAALIRAIKQTPTSP